MLTQLWDIQLMGALVISRKEERITHFPTEKVGLLLAYLAIFPQRIHSREDLTERFWPDSIPEDGRVSLRQALASMRRLLEPPDIPSGAVLVADRFHVQLNQDAYHTDLAMWDQLRALADPADTPQQRLHCLQAATGAYGGALLPGAYMEWVLVERQRRQEQYLETLLRLTDAYTECSDYADAISSAQLILLTDPLHEEAHERLMRLFVSQGKPGLARRQFRQLCRLMRDDLNLDPDPRLQTLYDNLKHMARQRPVLMTYPTIVSVEDQPEFEPVSPVQIQALPRLPLRLTRFFGREAEIARLHEWLAAPTVRLVTLTGTGGVGKTRLALEAVQETTRFGAAITFVPLSDTQDSELLLPTILQSMGMPVIASSDPFSRLVALLGNRPHLLVLDNFEQIAEQAAETLWRLLEQVTGVVCLVTSRIVLNLPGEYELLLTPLPIPKTDMMPQDLIANPTVQLLVDRMRTRRPDFQVTPINAGAVATLCTRLEGIPLAVELAAGWARDLTISQMQERMSHRFDLLVSHHRGVPQRHQSLRFAIESSYQLLPSLLQQFFLRLSVFRGGWQVEMAQIACDFEDDPSEFDPVEGLRVLREQSLITTHEAGERMRYAMLDTLRAYGQEMLTTEQTILLQARHAAWCLDFAREAAHEIHGPEQVYWLDRLEEEQDNLRGALEYGLAHDPLLGLHLANSLYWFWYVRGYFRTGEQWLTALLERVPDVSVSARAWGLLASGHFANCRSNNAKAVSHYKVAQELFEQIGDMGGMAHTFSLLGNAAQEMQEDPTTATRLCAEGVARFRLLNDTLGLLIALFYYANTQENAGHLELAVACYEEALVLAVARRDLRYQSLIQFSLGHCCRSLGDYSGALQGLRQALLLQHLTREPLLLSYILRNLAFLAARRGEPLLAVRLFGAHNSLRQRIGYSIALHEEAVVQELEVLLHTALSDADYKQGFEAGLALDFDPCLLLACEAAEKL